MKWLKFVVAFGIVAGIVIGTLVKYDHVIDSWWEFHGYMAALLFLSFIYSSAETAFLSLRSDRKAQGTEDAIASWKTQLQEEKIRGAWLRLRLYVANLMGRIIEEERFRSVLGVILILNNAVNLGFGILIGRSLVTDPEFELDREYLQIVCVLFPVIVFGEIIAKAVARKFTFAVALITYWFVLLGLIPFGWFANWLTGPFNIEDE